MPRKRFKLTWAHGKTRQPFYPATSASLPRTAEQSSTRPLQDRWAIQLNNISPITTPQLFRDLILCPLKLTNTVTLEVLSDRAEPALLVTFNHSAPFFTFTSSFPDGYIDLCQTVFFYIVPLDVLARRDFDKSRSSILDDTHLHAVPLSVTV